MRGRLSRRKVDTLSWRKSEFCAGGECFEAARDGDTVYVRSTQGDPRQVIEFSAAGWQAVVAGAKTGEWDYLAPETAAAAVS